MNIKTLEIKDFKNITHVKVDSDNKRIILIEGNPGQGKSAIIEALVYMLTDSLDDKISEYVRWGCGSFSIHCCFSHNGIDYDYEVEAGKSTKKKLIIEGEEFLNSEATKKLSTVIDFDLAKYSAIAEQGKTAQLLFQKPAERLKTLKSILKVERISDIVEEIKSDIKNKKSEITVIEAEIQQLESVVFNFMKEFVLPDIDDIQCSFDIMEKEKKSIEKKQEENSKALELKTNELKKVELEYAAIKSENEKIEIQEKSLADLEIKKSRFEKSLSQLQDVEEPVKDFEESDLTSMQEKLYSIKEEVKKIDSDIKGLKEGVCPTCLRPYENITKEEYEKRIQTCEDMKQELLEKSGMLQKEVDSLNNKVKQYNSLMTEYNSTIEKRKQYEEFITDLEEEMKKIVISDKKDCKEYQNTISTLSEEIQELKKNSVFSFDTKEYERLKGEIAVYSEKVKQLEEIKKFNENIESEKNKNSRIVGSKKRQKDTLLKEIRILDDTKDVLDKQFASYLITQGAEYLKNKMNAFFQRAYGRYQISFEQDKNSIDFFYSDYENNKKTSTVLASGHEKAVLSIANRVALSSIQDLGIMILDEIDSNAGDESSQKLFSTLLEEKSLNQFFIITHNEVSKEFLVNSPNSIQYKIVEGECV